MREHVDIDLHSIQSVFLMIRCSQMKKGETEMLSFASVLDGMSSFVCTRELERT